MRLFDNMQVTGRSKHEKWCRLVAWTEDKRQNTQQQMKISARKYYALCAAVNSTQRNRYSVIQYTMMLSDGIRSLHVTAKMVDYQPLKLCGP